MKGNTIEEKLQDLINIQCSNGNWDHSPYMRGLANGLLMAMSVVNGKDPNYLDEPACYLCLLKELDKFNNSPIIVSNANKADTVNEAN